MSKKSFSTPSRRAFIAGTAAFLGAPAIAQNIPAGQASRDRTLSARRNISSFRTLDWQPYFDNLRKGAILVDIDSRAVHYWNEEQTIYKLYPSSVPLTDELTRRGRTQVILKDPEPDWRPTPSMKKRNPEWPDYIGPSPENPLGSRALHRSWT